MAIRRSLWGTHRTSKWRCAAAGLACLLCTAGASHSWGADRVAQLPAGTTEVRVAGASYYYYAGVFYRADRDIYIKVEPPLGARVNAVPAGTSFSIGNDVYVLTGTGTFYLFDQRHRVYVVVRPPYNWRNYYRDPLAPQVQVYPQAYPPGYPNYYPDAYGRPFSDRRAVREATCRQVASDVSRRDTVTGSVSSRKQAQYRDAYRECIDSPSRRRR